MNHQGDERSGRTHRSSLFSRRGVRHRENEEPDDETLTEDPYVVRVAELVRSMDSHTPDRSADDDAQHAEAEQAEAEQADPEQADPEQADAERPDAGAVDTAQAVEPAEVAAELAVAEPADESAEPAVHVADPAATRDDGPGAAQVVGDVDEAGVDSAARVLGLAQKLHDEYVAEGQSARDRLIREGEAKHEELVSAGEAERLALIAAADASVIEAQQKKAAMLQGLDSERRLLQEEIEELRSFESDYRAQLRSYLEGQLTELGQIGAHETGQDSSGGPDLPGVSSG
jgi:hypothetical protein